MKKTILKLTAFLLIFTSILFACKKTDDPKEPEINYPIDILFTEYSLEGTSCQWKNLPCDEKVIIINSIADLETYLSFTEKSYPIINFSKNSLLLISGKTVAVGIDMISTNVTQISAIHFQLDIEMALAATAAEDWCVALITKKIKDESLFELNVTYKEPITTLQGTTWKGIGFVDVETGTLEEFEPKWDECYTVSFYSDTAFSGETATNTILWATYEIDYKTGGFYITNCIMTLKGEIGHGSKYVHILPKIRTFIVKDTNPRTLHLYYNDGKNYLKYKEIGGRK